MTSYDILDDEELVARLKEGDTNAFTEIYDRYKWILHTHAYKWLSDREEAKDVVHELFSQLWSDRMTLTITHNFSGYLYTCLRNSIFKTISRKKVKSKYMDSLQEVINTNYCITDHLVRENEMKRIIEDELAALPPRMRQVFEMSRNEHLRHSEIAKELNLSEQTVRKHIQHALKILRVRLGLIAFILLNL